MRNINDFKFRGYDTELEKMTYFDDDDYILSCGQIQRSKNIRGNLITKFE